MTPAAGLAAVAGAAGTLAAWDLFGPGVVSHGAGAVRGLAGLVDVVVALGREGRDPGVVERRRLLLVGAVLALAAGSLLIGPVAGLALAAGGPWAVSRLLRARERYRRAVDAELPALALALADALAGGHSLRGAVAEATRSLSGAAGHELRRVRGELAAGAPTDVAISSPASAPRPSRPGRPPAGAARAAWPAPGARPKSLPAASALS
jgi:tight adherence protein B